ncbi:MAG: hypothetical protein V7K72_01355 [Nostoc sp.]|uniref:hypothetical protein n=1 Tax=Nostoc sp. TaxID=1180 RepID=UPI002FF8E1C8
MISTNLTRRRDEAAEIDGGEANFFQECAPQPWRWYRCQTDLHHRTFLGSALSGCANA